MHVVSLCPLRGSSVLWQPRPNAHALTVVCKATYELLPVQSRLADEQEPPSDLERHWDDDPAASLHAPSDRAPFKRRADVLLVGHAFAPERRPVQSLVARLAIGGIDKSILVFGERAWMPDGRVTAPHPFVKMPLRYERASGEPETENPVGVRSEVAGALPNLQPRGVPLQQDRPIPPIGFGPIAMDWPARTGKLGPQAAAWLTEAWQTRPLPDDLDASFFNAAPADQRVDRIAPDATIVLDNLDAQHARLRTTLPGVQPRAIVERATEGSGELPMIADTLWIDTDRSICTLVWRGVLTLRDPQEEGVIKLLLEHLEKPLTPAEIKRLISSPAPERRPKARADTSRAELDGDTQKVQARRAPPSGPGAPLRAAPDLPFVPAPLAPSSARPIAEPPMLAPVMTSTPVLTASAMTSAPVLTAPIASPVVAPSPPALAPLPAAPSPPARAQAPSDLLAISNAAAAPWSASRAADPEPPQPSPAPQPPAEIVELLWFDPAMLVRIREHPPWRDLLELLAPRPPDIRYDDDAPPPEEPQDVKDRREVFSILVEAEPVTEAALDEVIARALGPMGAFRPPLALLAGDLHLPFDELETLKATVAAAAPLAPGDKKLKELIETVNELLKTPWLEGESGVAETLTSRVREAFSQSGRLLPAGHLDAHTERRLLAQRHYQRRTVLGRRWLRALLTSTSTPASPANAPAAASAPAGIPAYIPDDLATLLPMFQRFRVRLIAEVHLQQDQYETHPHALRAVALARVAPGPKPKR